MESGAMEDRLLHAKKLLKKYQKKHDHHDDCANEIEMDTQLAKSSREVGITMDGPSSNYAENGSITRSPSILSERPPDMDEVSNLRALYASKEVELADALDKLQHLHNLYAELHAAYNNLASQTQNTTGNATPSAEYTLQISQLQTALAVAIEDRTNLQSQLRDLQANLEVLESENKRRKDSSLSVHSLTSKLESEIIALKEEKSRFLETITNQSQQIKSQRKECSELEAKILLVHQDRNETQARLKYVCEEKRNLENSLAQLNRDLNMKDIYIRQLTHFSENNPAQDQQVIQTLTEERNRANEEVMAKQLQLLEVQKQFDSSCEHYENCFGELRSQISTLEKEVQQLTAAKAELESIRCYQEEQLRLLKASVDAKKESENENAEAANANAEEFAALQERYASLESDFLRSRTRIQDLESSVEQKDTQLENIQFENINLQNRIADLEEANRLRASINSDVSSLSEQLQNEKATVSRAVEQNLQLKSQLVELQNKIVMVINESAAKEDERITALNQVKILTQRLESISNGYFEHKDQPHVASSDSLGKQSEYANSMSNGFSTVSETQHISSSRSVKDSGAQTDNETDVNSERTKSSGDSTEKHLNGSEEPTKSAEVLNLEERLQSALSRETELKKTNERLEYLLTALEMENESIGEYIALYRYQRANLQDKLRQHSSEQQQQSNGTCEKPASPAKCSHSFASACKVKESGQGGMKCSGCVECRGELVNL